MTEEAKKDFGDGMTELEAAREELEWRSAVISNLMTLKRENEKNNAAIFWLMMMQVIFTVLSIYVGSAK